MDASTTTVMIADKTGHTTLQLTQQETVDKSLGWRVPGFSQRPNGAASRIG